MAKRQIFPPLQTQDILTIVEGQQFCCMWWGKEEQKGVSKGWPPFFALHSKAGRSHSGRTPWCWRFAAIGDHSQAVLSHPKKQSKTSKLLNARISEMLASAHDKGDDCQDKISRSPFIAWQKVGINGKDPSLGEKLVCGMVKREVLLWPKHV